MEESVLSLRLLPSIFVGMKKPVAAIQAKVYAEEKDNL
jgi:hypothetical protein